jgi:hypothetical protein
MQYVVGAIVAIIFMSGLMAAFYFGYRIGAARKKINPAPDLPPDETQQRREEQLRRDLELLSGYNLSKALERKKV